MWNTLQPLLSNRLASLLEMVPDFSVFQLLPATPAQRHFTTISARSEFTLSRIFYLNLQPPTYQSLLKFNSCQNHVETFQDEHDKPVTSTGYARPHTITTHHCQRPGDGEC